MKNLIFVSLLFLTSTLVAQKSSVGYVQRVIDGDTYVVDMLSYKGSPATITVRIVNVDCPELAFIPKRRPAQEFGQEATDSVKALIENKTVELTYYGKDFFGRVIAFVYIEGKRLDNIILAKGWGWQYTGYHKGKGYKEGTKLMESAKAQKLGLWALPNPIEPSIYRKK